MQTGKPKQYGMNKGCAKLTAADATGKVLVDKLRAVDVQVNIFAPSYGFSVLISIERARLALRPMIWEA